MFLELQTIPKPILRSRYRYLPTYHPFAIALILQNSAKNLNKFVN